MKNRNLLTCDACGADFPEDLAEASKNDLVVCPECKKLEDDGADLRICSVIAEIMDELGALPLPPKKKVN